MIRYSPLSILIFFLLTFLPVFGQESISEKDFTVHYYSTRLELEFDKSKAPSSIKVTNALSNNEVPIEKTTNPNFFIINSNYFYIFFKKNIKIGTRSSTAISNFLQAKLSL